MSRKKQPKAPGELDPVSERLMEFVNQKGGPSPVAGKMGKHPQLFYNIREGLSKPSMDTLREVKLVYPDLDFDWVIIGKAKEPVLEAVVMAVNEKNEVQAVDPEKAMLLHKIALLTQQNEMLKSENERVWRMNLPESAQKELSFTEASSQSTVCTLNRKLMEVEGLIRYEEKLTERERKTLPVNSLIRDVMELLATRIETEEAE